MKYLLNERYFILSVLNFQKHTLETLRIKIYAFHLKKKIETKKNSVLKQNLEKTLNFFQTQCFDLRETKKNTEKF